MQQSQLTTRDANALKAADQNISYADSLIKMLVGSIFIAVCAQIHVPMHPVPMTMQPFAVIILGLLFPWRQAAGAVVMYIAETAMGLPVLVGFAGGLHTLFGTTAGYIWGYIPMIVVISYLLQVFGKRSFLTKVVAVLAGQIVQLTCGVTVLAGFIGLESSIMFGLFPFVVQDLIKMGLAVTFIHLFKTHPLSIFK